VKNLDDTFSIPAQYMHMMDRLPDRHLDRFGISKAHSALAVLCWVCQNQRHTRAMVQHSDPESDQHDDNISSYSFITEYTGRNAKILRDSRMRHITWWQWHELVVYATFAGDEVAWGECQSPWIWEQWQVARAVKYRFTGMMIRYSISRHPQLQHT